ncbi:hypothetical protein ISN75_06630 [Dyella marensis]|uniref:hypothetical protein n=1 Tax=Dyella marensis TaxID=500610 RepID=UPI0031E237B1
MSTKPLPMLELRDQIAKAIAYSVGHGMREKCEKQADAVLSVVMPQLTATADHAVSAHLSAQAKVRVTDDLPPLPKPHLPAVYATDRNTVSVRKGFEMGGYEKEPAYFTESQMRAYALAARLSHGAQACTACEPDGVFDTDGNGPYDCYACGKKAQGAQGEDRSSWSLHDRVEFALRDAGLSLDEASRIAMNAERAAAPDIVFQNLAQIADGGELSRSDMQDMASEAYNLLRRSLTAAPQPPEGARVVASMNDETLCNIAENYGAEICWANEPDQFHHIITLTPPQLRSMLLAAPTLAGKEG